MNAKTKTQGILKNLIIIFILIGATATVSGYEDVDLDVSFDDTRIAPGDDAILIVEIRNDENDDITVDIEIFEILDDDEESLDDDTISIDYGERKTINYTLNDYNKWDPYICGDRKIKVEVERETVTKTIRISGDDFRIKISPTDPPVDDEITITIEDEREHEVDGEYIIITNLDTEDDIREKTDEDGVVEITLEDEREFDDSPAGSYEVMVDNKNGNIDPDYCSTKKTFNVRYTVNKNDIEIIDPKLPNVPQVNEQVTIKITTTGDKPARLADVTVTGPGFNEILETNSDGYIYFIPKSQGDYNVKITDTRYVSVTKTIAVATQSQLSISFSSDPEVGKELTMIVKADGKAVNGAEITITDPGGQKKSLTTKSDGKTTFDVGDTGKYTITAKKSGYADSTKDFEVYKSFRITVPTSANVGDMVEVKVLDTNDDPVEDATIKGENFALNKKTDSSGVIEFKIEELKNYKISIEKTGFTKVERTITSEGELTIKLTPEKPQKNKDLTIGIFTGGDIPVALNIKIIKPDGTVEEVDDSKYTFLPEQVGKYTITGSKAGYSDVSVDFNVMHSVMKLEYDVVDGNLVFKITTSDGEPVSGADVGIYATTNEEGIAELKFDNNYNVTVMKENYETTKGPIQVQGTISFSEILTVFVILVLILIILILFLRGRKEGEEKQGLKR